MRRIEWLGVASRAALATVAVGATIMLAACGNQVAGGQSAPSGQSPSGVQSTAADQSASAGKSASADGKAAPIVGSGSADLCTDIPHLTSVVVSRTSGFRDSRMGSIQPRGITIVEPALVRGLAAALCGLPEMPRIALTCPAEFGVGSLRFAFAAGGRPYAPVVVQLSGCRVVTGLGAARRASSAAFWQTVDQDLGGLASLPSPNSSGGIRP